MRHIRRPVRAYATPTPYTDRTGYIWRIVWRYFNQRALLPTYPIRKKSNRHISIMKQTLFNKFYPLVNCVARVLPTKKIHFIFHSTPFFRDSIHQDLWFNFSRMLIRRTKDERLALLGSPTDSEKSDQNRGSIHMYRYVASCRPEEDATGVMDG